MKNLLVFLLFSHILFSQTPENQYFKSFDGVKIAYFVEGAGKPIMLVPGFRGTKNNWQNTPLKNKLITANYQVISMDTRGLGFSDKPQKNEDYADDAEVKDLIALANHLNFKKYDCLGYSRGSILTAKLLTKDKRIKKAVLGGMGEDFTNPNWDRRIMFAEIFGGKAHLYPDGPAILADAQKRNLDTLLLGYMQRNQPVTTVNELNKIKIPVLVISGDKDIDNGHPDVLVKYFKKGVLKITDGNHGGAVRTERFAEEVLKFLKE